jgi:hypothetical protein
MCFSPLPPLVRALKFPVSKGIARSLLTTNVERNIKQEISLKRLKKIRNCLET